MKDQSNLGKVPDYRDENEINPIGTIVSVVSHPFHTNNTRVKIGAYARMTPPLMIVVEKHYGSKYNPINGDEEDNCSFRCLYYSTVNGCFETNWFKRKEIKFISAGDVSLFLKHKNTTIESVKKELLGKSVILTTVDLELGKVKVWNGSEGNNRRTKENSLLDYLPPVGSIIDVKTNDDYQKYSEKSGKPLYRKTKILVKLRWLNGLTSKFSEEYVPLSALKSANTNYIEYSSSLCYPFKVSIELEDNAAKKMKALPLVPTDVIWKHYYYEYRFGSLVSNDVFTIKGSDTDKLGEPIDPRHIFSVAKFDDRGISTAFSLENKSKIEGNWFEIQYSDKNERYTRRIIYVQEMQEEEGSEGPRPMLLKSNCLLRGGKIRHFRVDRIKGYRKMPAAFMDTFTEVLS